MDFESIKNQVSNLSLYDIKAGVRKVQNAVMNYTEMEAKVREATNNEPWGASTTTMQDIANGTFNYQTLNEIMPMIYRRFTEKAAEEWRQIYKALQLLEFLIKNGSERVIDDARSHLSLLKMLKQFHFIDLNGKDQGINVRNRAKELTDLLGDVERIRAERKKARTTRNKYGGVEGGSGIGGSMSTSSYGGSGRDEGYGSYSGGVYGDGGGFGGNTSTFSDTSGRRDRYEEYDEYDEGAVASPTTRRKPDTTASSKRPSQKASAPEPPKKKEPEVDLFDFGDDNIAAPALSSSKAAAPVSANNGFGSFQAASNDDDDDFDDFQSALPASSSQATSSTSNIPPPIAAPHSLAPAPSANLFNTTSPPATSSTPNYAAFSAQSTPLQAQPAAKQAPRPSGYQAAQPNYFGSVSIAASTPQVATAASTPGSAGGYKPSPAPGVKKPASGGDPFAMLAGGLGGKSSTAMTTKGPTMADLSKQKAQAGIWGAPANSSAGGAGQNNGSNSFGDLI